MQIVIDIDTVDYEYIKNGCFIPIEIDNHIYNAIRKGTLLPKGHGRLKDTDKFNYNSDNYITKHGVESAPTVIEADMAESEE